MKSFKAEILALSSKEKADLIAVAKLIPIGIIGGVVFLFVSILTTLLC